MFEHEFQNQLCILPICLLLPHPFGPDLRHAGRLRTVTWAASVRCRCQSSCRRSRFSQVGTQIAKVAMPRRLAIRLYWMWRKGWDYERSGRSYLHQNTRQGHCESNPSKRLDEPTFSELGSQRQHFIRWHWR